MNFCVTILILNIEENMQHFQYIMLYFKKGKNTTEMQKRFVQCIEKVLWLIECVKSGLWRFCAGDFSLDHAPWLGRQAEIDSKQIETWIENN